MTTYDRAVSSGHPDDAGSLNSAASTPAPEGPPLAPPVAGPDRRTFTAYHESGHACAQICLFGLDAVEVVSIRRGKVHAGITLLGTKPPADRREAELDIIVTLAGPAAEWYALATPGLPRAGYLPGDEDEDEAVAAAATASLDRLAPIGRDRLLAAESRTSGESDESRAESDTLTLAGYFRDESQAHHHYLQCAASSLVRRHLPAIRDVAEALLRDVTLDGPTVARLVMGRLCLCHRWERPTEDPVPDPQGG